MVTGNEKRSPVGIRDWSSNSGRGEGNVAVFVEGVDLTEALKDDQNLTKQ